MKASRSLPALLAGTVALALAAAAAGQAGPPRTPSGSLPSYVEGWSAREDNLLDFAVDDRDRVWLLTREPAFVRLDEQGKAAEKIPFAWPADLDKSQALDQSFAVAGSDFVVGRYRFDHRGRRVAVYPFRQAGHLAPGLKGTLVRLSDRGLEIFDRKGRLLRSPGENGAAPEKISEPLDLTVDRRGNIFVAERRRLQVFDFRGRFVRTLPIPVEPGSGSILGVTSDGDGYLYVTLSAGATIVAVYNPEMRYLGALPFDWSWYPASLTADREGRLYGLSPGPARVLQQALPASGTVRQARPLEAGLPEETLQRVQPAVEIPVEAIPVDSRGWPFRLHTSTRSVFQTVADPRNPERLWLGTEGGLAAYHTGKGTWSRWTQAEGLPAQEVRSLAIEDRKVHMVLSKGLGFFDLRSSRFWSWQLRGERVPQPLEGIRVLSSSDSPGILWWIMNQGLLRHDVAAGAWSFFPAPDVPEPRQWVDGAVAAKGRIFLASRTEVWELRLKRKKWRRVCGASDLDRAASARKDRDFPPAIEGLSMEDGGDTLWIGTYDGLFRVEPQSGRVTWPEESRGERTCRPRRIVRQGGRRLAFGYGCVREIGPAECCTIDRNLRDVRDALPDPRQPDLLWLATPRGLASLRLADGQLTTHLPTGREPDGSDVMDLLAVEGRLWLATTNTDVSVLDPAAKTWASFPGAFNVQSVHRSSATGDLLVVSGYRRLVWFDPRTAEQVPGPGRWPERTDWGMNLHHDERGLWGQAAPSPGGFFFVQSDGTFRIVREGPFQYAARSLVPDPTHPGDFLVVWSQSLARLDPESGDFEVLRPGVQGIRLAGDRYLWITGRPSARLDLQTGEVAALGLEGRLIPDPRHPDQAWLVRFNFLALYDVVRGERLAAITLDEDVIAREVAVLEDRLWVGSNVGLLEIPLAALTR